MSAIACWIERVEVVPKFMVETIWAVADSRISEAHKDAGGKVTYSTLHDHAPKIFSIPITIRGPNEHGAFEKSLYQNSVGFAYSGSSLIGCGVSQAVTPLLTSLIAIDPKQQRPRLIDIAVLVGHVFYEYMKALGFSVGERANAEFAVMGLCPATMRMQLFCLRPEIDTSMKIAVSLMDTSPDDAYLLLGHRKEDIEKLIDEERSKHPQRSVPWWRAPRTVIERCIADPSYPTIGGTIQLAVGKIQEFGLRWIAKPTGEGAKASMSYLGLTVLNEARQIGPCMIGMTGMAG